MDHPLQAIRRAYEEPIEQALAALSPSIPCLTANQLYDENDALSEFALVRLSFGLMSTLEIGCQTEYIRGSGVVEVYTAKGVGPGRGQDAAVAILQALAPLRGMFPPLLTPGVTPRIGVVQGPTFTPLTRRPHLSTVITFPFSARISDPSPAPPEPPAPALKTKARRKHSR